MSLPNASGKLISSVQQDSFMSLRLLSWHQLSGKHLRPRKQSRSRCLMSGIQLSRNRGKKIRLSHELRFRCFKVLILQTLSGGAINETQLHSSSFRRLLSLPIPHGKLQSGGITTLLILLLLPLLLPLMLLLLLLLQLLKLLLRARFLRTEFLRSPCCIEWALLPIMILKCIIEICDSVAVELHSAASYMTGTTAEWDQHHIDIVVA